MKSACIFSANFKIISPCKGVYMDLCITIRGYFCVQNFLPLIAIGELHLPGTCYSFLFQHLWRGRMQPGCRFGILYMQCGWRWIRGRVCSQEHMFNAEAKKLFPDWNQSLTVISKSIYLLLLVNLQSFAWTSRRFL